MRLTYLVEVSPLIETAPVVISFGAGIFVPMITEAITHSTAPAWVRTVLNFVLSALVGALATAALSQYNSVYDYLLAVIVAWLASMRSHYAGLALPIASLTADFGIGKSPNAPSN